MAERRPNPVTLAWWAIGGATLASSVWWLGFLPVPRYPVIGHGLWPLLWAGRLQAMVLFGPLLCGIPIWLRSESRFKDGVRNEVWSEAELAPVRAVLESRYWKWLGFAMLALCLGALACLAFGVRVPSGAFIYLMTLPMQTVGQMRRAVTPPVKGRGGLLDWNGVKPIQSEHWGGRGDGGSMHSQEGLI